MKFLTKLKNSIMQYLRNTNKSLVLLCMLASGYGILLVYSAALSLNYSGPKTVIMQYSWRLPPV